MKLLNKLQVWWYKRIYGDKMVEKMVDKLTENLKIEETPECFHNTLEKILPKDEWYRCLKCHTVFLIHGVTGWDKRSFNNLLKGLEKSKK